MGMFASISALIQKCNDNNYLVGNNTSISDTKIKKHGVYKAGPRNFSGKTQLVHVLDSWDDSPPTVIRLVDYHATRGQKAPFI